MKKYVVTGGCGFIGSHLTQSLIENGNQVTIVDNLSSGNIETLHPKAKLVLGDVRDVNLMLEVLNDADGCFHLAAISSVETSTKSWLNTHSINLSGTINVFECASKSNNVSVVYASSAAVYGDNANTPLSEYTALRPLSAYGADKLGCELHARIAGITHQLPTAGIRLFNVYGPRHDTGSHFSGVISKFIKNIAENKPITLHGDGSQTRDFIFISDVIRFLIMSMQHTSIASPVYNLCSGSATSIKQLIQTLFSIAGYSVPVREKKLARGDIRMSVGDPKLAYQQLNFSASTSLLQGLEETIRQSQINHKKRLAV